MSLYADDDPDFGADAAPDDDVHDDGMFDVDESAPSAATNGNGDHKAPAATASASASASSAPAPPAKAKSATVSSSASMAPDRASRHRATVGRVWSRHIAVAAASP